MKQVTKAPKLPLILAEAFVRAFREAHAVIIASPVSVQNFGVYQENGTVQHRVTPGTSVCTISDGRRFVIFGSIFGNLALYDSEPIDIASELFSLPTGLFCDLPEAGPNNPGAYAVANGLTKEEIYLVLQSKDQQRATMLAHHLAAQQNTNTQVTSSQFLNKLSRPAFKGK